MALTISRVVDLLGPVLGLRPEAGPVAPTPRGYGHLWADTSGTVEVLRHWNGTSWVACDGRDIPDGTITNAKIASSAAIALSKLATDPLDRTNHTNTQTADTISDFDTQVRTSRLDQMAAPSASVSLNSQIISNVGAGESPNDAARLVDVQNALAGIDPKESVRAATTGPITLSGEQTVDTVALTDGMRVLVKNQASAPANDIYVVSSGAWSRADETIGPDAFVFVEEGTQADTSWVMTSDDPFTRGVSDQVWVQWGAGATYSAGTGLELVANEFALDIPVAVASGGTGATAAAQARTNLGVPGVYAANLPALTAGVPVTVTHNLGTMDLVPWGRFTADNAPIILEVVPVTVNTATVTVDKNFSSGDLRIVLVGG